MKIGQTVYLTRVTPITKEGITPIKTAVIEKIDKKHVTVSRYGRFDIKTGAHVTLCIKKYNLFLNKEELDKEVDRKNELNKIACCGEGYIIT